MGGMKDLWEAQQYPAKAGWKDPGISRENAKRIDKTGRAADLRTRVRDLFASGFEGTADEAAATLGEDLLAIRPRCTELMKLNVIERTPVRRRGAGGGSAAVLRIRQCFNHQN